MTRPARRLTPNSTGTHSRHGGGFTACAPRRSHLRCGLPAVARTGLVAASTGSCEQRLEMGVLTALFSTPIVPHMAFRSPQGDRFSRLLAAKIPQFRSAGDTYAIG